MVRWVILGVLVIGLTSVATVAMQLMPSATSDRPMFPTGSKKIAAGPQPKVVVDGDTTFNFGTKSQKTVGEKTWTVRNEGPGDLILKKGPPACSCTVAKLGPKDVSNDKDFAVTLTTGESLDVQFRFETRDNVNHYHKEIELLTNDSEREHITFVFDGNVQPPFVTYPPANSFNFMNLSNDVDHSAKISLYSYNKPDFKVESIVSSRPEEIIVSAEPMTDEERTALKLGDGGYMIHVTLKKGMSIGTILEEILIKTDNPLKPDFTIPVTGVASGPISSIPDQVRLFAVNSSQGGNANLTLLVRGQKETKFTVADHPEKLNVTVTPSDQQSEEVSKYRLSVTVPPGTPAGEIKGMIVLKTDHPLATDLKIPVTIFVRNPG